MFIFTGISSDLWIVLYLPKRVCVRVFIDYRRAAKLISKESNCIWFAVAWKHLNMSFDIAIADQMRIALK